MSMNRFFSQLLPNAFSLFVFSEARRLKNILQTPLPAEESAYGEESARLQNRNVNEQLR